MVPPEGFEPSALLCPSAKKGSETWFFDLPPQLLLKDFAGVDLSIPAGKAAACTFKCAGKRYSLAEIPKEERQCLTPLYPVKGKGTLVVGMSTPPPRATPLLFPLSPSPMRGEGG